MYTITLNWMNLEYGWELGDRVQCRLQNTTPPSLPPFCLREGNEEWTMLVNNDILSLFHFEFSPKFFSNRYKQYKEEFFLTFFPLFYPQIKYSSRSLIKEKFLGRYYLNLLNIFFKILYDCSGIIPSSFNHKRNVTDVKI